MKAAMNTIEPGSEITVGLVQINNSFSNQSYLPYSVGVLQAYVQSNSEDADRYNFLLPIFRRGRIDDAVNTLIDADVVGFSAYVWNHEISLEIARRLKQKKAEILIVFGGPHVPDHPQPWLRENHFVDVAVHNEGERTFLNLLENWPNRDWSAIEGISYIDANDGFVRNENAPRFRDLSHLPSPFLQGTFAPLINANPLVTWIGLWETNRGCPFRCTFCDWGSATAAKVTKFEEERLRAEVDWFAQHQIDFIFCCDANFGIQKRDVDLAKYVAEVKARTGYPKALSVQNTKNATERAYLTQKILSDAGLNKGVALSMQSMDASTLSAVKRDNISLNSYMELQRRFTKDGVETYSDLILGMPGETYQSFLEGIGRLIESGQHNRIQFNNLSILPNAEMGDPAYQEKFGMQTVRSEIINIHGERVALDDDVPEFQDLVIATNSLPKEDWRRVRALCWMVALLHFDKVLQIPMIVAHELFGIDFVEMFEAFMETKLPTIASVKEFFLSEAESIQNGGPEYVFSADYLGIYWPADEYQFIDLTVNKKFDDFYEESKQVLCELIGLNALDAFPSIIEDAVTLNRALLKQPHKRDDKFIELGYNLPTFWDGIRCGEPIKITAVETTLRISRSSAFYDDLQRWCREVVWWGNKKGAYLYSQQEVEPQLAGHY